MLNQNPAEALFQAEGNVVFYGNVLANTHGESDRDTNARLSRTCSVVCSGAT